jgi:hypothetical protein
LRVHAPTQFGAAFTLWFVCVALYVALQLGVQSNASMVNTLQPASANNNTGSSRGAWEVTVRAYGAPPAGSALLNAVDRWCLDSAGAPLAASGFDGSPTLRYTIVGDACVLLIDCLDCGLGGVGSLSISVPAVAQLLEWEVWATGAIPGAWSRFYGVASQQSGKMLDAASTLRFSAMEAYFIDTRSAQSITYCTDSDANVQVGLGVTCSLPTGNSGSGFELAFSDWETDTQQDAALLTADSTVTLRLLFSKQDVVYQTTVTAKLTVFQVLSSILATVVSLLSVFAVVFALSERHILRRLKLTSGHVDTKVHIISDEERAVEEKHKAMEAAKRAQSTNGNTTAVTKTISGGGAYLSGSPTPPSPRKVTVELMSPSAPSRNSFMVVPQLPSLDAHGAPEHGLAAHGDVHELLSTHNTATASPSPLSPAGPGVVLASSVTSSAELAKEVRELRAERAQTNAAIAALQAQLQQMQQRLNQSSNGRSPRLIDAAAAAGLSSPSGVEGTSSDGGTSPLPPNDGHTLSRRPPRQTNGASDEAKDVPGATREEHL